MKARRLVAAAALAGLMLAVPTSGEAAQTTGSCSARADLAAGWGGSRYVPVPPQGVVGASCTFFTLIADRVFAVVTGAVQFGGIQVILPDGRRFYCREPVAETVATILGTRLGATYPNAFCTYYSIGGRVELAIDLTDQPIGFGEIYCSTTGEAGYLVEIVCGSTFS
jgi:hypothetical protein